MSCGASDTFAELALKVGEYFSIHNSFLFFAVLVNQDDSDPFNCAIYPMDSTLTDMLYPWKGMKLRFVDPSVYVVLRSFESVEDIVQDFESNDSSESDEFEGKEIALSKLIGDRFDKEEQDVRQQIASRMAKHKYFAVAETGLYLCILVFWLVYVAISQNINELNAMNTTIMRAVTGTRHVGDVTYSTYESDFLQKSSFFSTRSASSIYAFISNIEFNIYLAPYASGNDGTAITEGIRMFPYFSIRTKRSKVEQCNIADFEVDSLCPTDLSHEITGDIGQRPPYIEWSEGDTRSIGLRSYRSVTPVSGYTLAMPSNNYTEFKLNQHLLTDVDYISMNTRYIATTLNFYSAGRELVALHAYIFEFDLEANIVASYDLYSYSSSDYNPTEYILVVIIALACLCHLALVGRHLFTSLHEIEYTEQRKVHQDNFKLEELRNTLNSWTSHCSQGYLSRLRRPNLQEAVVILSSLGVATALFAKMGWYFSVFQAEFDMPNDDYIDLLYVAQLRQIVYDFQGFILILQGIGAFKYVMLWYSPMAFISNMLRNGILRLKGFFTVVFIALVGYSICFYLVIGPYEYRSASLYLLIAGISRCFSGRWFAGDDFTSFIGPFNVIILLSSFMLFRYVVMVITVINLQQAYMQTQDLYEAGQIKHSKGTERNLKASKGEGGQ